MEREVTVPYSVQMSSVSASLHMERHEPRSPPSHFLTQGEQIRTRDLSDSRANFLNPPLTNSMAFPKCKLLIYHPILPKLKQKVGLITANIRGLASFTKLIMSLHLQATATSAKRSKWESNVPEQSPFHFHWKHN